MTEESAKPLYSLWTKVKQGASVARLRPFDTSTPEGRSRERYRRVALTALASVAARGITFPTKLITVPLALGYLGTERYGLFVTIFSVSAMLALADLGMGNGLLNAISETNGRDDREAARRYVSSAFFVLFGIAAALAVLFAFIYPWVPWEQVFNVSTSQAIAEAGPSIAIFVGCFLASLPLSVARQTQMGYQEGYATNLWDALGSLLGLGGMLLAIRLEAGLPWLVLAMAGAPALALFLNGVALFKRQRPWLRPRLRNAQISAAKRVSQTGLLFLTLQIAVVIVFYSDYLVVAQIFGADEVTQYAVPWQLFMIPPLILGPMLMPLWPAYGEAIARGDVSWVKTTLYRSLVIGLLITVPAATFLVLFGTQVIHFWVGPEVTPPFLLLLGLGLYTIILHGIDFPIGMLLNGANALKFQAVVASLSAIVNLAASITLAYLIGLPGVIFGTVISELLFATIPCILYVPRLLSSISEKHSADKGSTDSGLQKN